MMGTLIPEYWFQTRQPSAHAPSYTTTSARTSSIPTTLPRPLLTIGTDHDPRPNPLPYHRTTPQFKAQRLTYWALLTTTTQRIQY